MNWEGDDRLGCALIGKRHCKGKCVNGEKAWPLGSWRARRRRRSGQSYGQGTMNEEKDDGEKETKSGAGRRNGEPGRARRTE